MKCSHGISSFLEEISRFPLSIVSLHLHCSSRKPFLPLLAMLGHSAFRRVDVSFPPFPLASLLFSAACEAPADTRCASLRLSRGRSLNPSWNLRPGSSDALCATRTPDAVVTSARARRDWIQVIAEGPRGSSYLLQFKSEFYHEELMMRATASSRSCSC